MIKPDQVIDYIARHFHQAEPNTNATSLLQHIKGAAAYQALNRLVGLAVPFATRNHFKVEKLSKGYLRASIQLKGNRNHMGTLYAGAQFLLAEIPGGVLTISELGSNYVPILKELTMTYLKPAKSDVSVEFTLSPGEIDQIASAAAKHGKTEFTLHGKLLDNKGQCVAQSKALYQVRKK